MLRALKWARLQVSGQVLVREQSPDLERSRPLDLWVLVPGAQLEAVLKFLLLRYRLLRAFLLKDLVLGYLMRSDRCC